MHLNTFPGVLIGGDLDFIDSCKYKVETDVQVLDCNLEYLKEKFE